eukprot:TRINITY_DN11285_c0_g1_i5.p2 TRINITY_DN11285_c0_g1~~TRINITY_DN11285_c0_g1_i5.p2  ORF type:complete len:130 (-),score=23.86 TRINITY_DN11285_c0_g1_i5:308-697(-)
MLRCHRYGHYQFECRTNLSKECSEKSNFVEKEEVSFLLVCHAKEETHQNLWYLDRGCSNHMCGDKSTFSNLDKSFRDSVKFVDNSKVSLLAEGKIEGRFVAMAFLLWASKLWWTKDIAAETYGDTSSSN